MRARTSIPDSGKECRLTSATEIGSRESCSHCSARSGVSAMTTLLIRTDHPLAIDRDVRTSVNGRADMLAATDLQSVHPWRTSGITESAAGTNS